MSDRGDISNKLRNVSLEGGKVGRGGTVFIVSGPSGAGKSSLSDWALTHMDDLVLSISTTTRAMRGDECEGEHYNFVNDDRFSAMLENSEFAEWAEVHGKRYGTPKAPLEEHLREGRDVLLDVDVQGAESLRQVYPQAVSVFLLPPSKELLRQRLSGRGTDSGEVVDRRMRNACREIRRLTFYDYLIVNDRLEDTCQAFESLVVAARLRTRAIPENDQMRIIRAFQEDE